MLAPIQRCDSVDTVLHTPCSHRSDHSAMLMDFNHPDYTNLRIYVEVPVRVSLDSAFHTEMAVAIKEYLDHNLN